MEATIDWKKTLVQCLIKESCAGILPNSDLDNGGIAECIIVRVCDTGQYSSREVTLDIGLVLFKK